MKYLILLFLFCLGFSTAGLTQEGPAPHNNSYIAFSVPEKDLLPESVAYDPVNDAFFVSSTRKGKILRIKDGTVDEFISSKSHGLWMTVGIRVDAERRILWVCSSGGNNLEGYTKKDDVEGRPAGIFKFDLDTGDLINKYTLEEPGGVHFFNDLVVARNGDLYATHMFEDHAVYRIASDTDELERFAQDERIRYPNGIALADNQTILFVAHADGIARIDLESGTVTNLTIPEGVNVARQASIDGLSYYRWSLIGIQADLGTVNRYFLNDEGTGIDEVSVLERAHPIMDHPTTGVVVGDVFYYIANSQFGRISEEGQLFPMNQLYEPVILKVNLLSESYDDSP